MDLHLTINSQSKTFSVSPKDRLIDVLRRKGYFGVKHGCDDGSCGAGTFLIDGKPINSCTLLAAQVNGKSITIIDGVGAMHTSPEGEPPHGWKGNVALHPLQKAFVETGAIQCGFCTPAMILAAQSLLDQNPTESKVHDVLGGGLYRCTNNAKPVQAIMHAIHDEHEYMNFADSDPSKNLAAKILIDIGDVDVGFAQASLYLAKVWPLYQELGGSLLAQLQ